MTRAEFDVWIEQHYSELLKVARRRTNSDDDAADVVGRVIVAALQGRWYEQSEKPWTRAVLGIKSYAQEQRRLNDHQGEIRREVKKIHRSTASHGWKRPAPRAE